MGHYRSDKENERDIIEVIKKMMIKEKKGNY